MVLGGPAGRYRSVVRVATDLFFPNAARLAWARGPTDSNGSIPFFAFSDFQ